MSDLNKKLTVLWLGAVIVLLLIPASNLTVAPAHAQTSQASSITLYNPWVKKNNIYQGALHFHSNKSDGAYSPEQMFAAYRKQGFDFAVLTDHAVVTTFSAPTGLLAISGEEVNGCKQTSSCVVGSPMVHIGAIGITTTIKRAPAQDAINSITQQGGVTALNHPSLAPWDYTDDMLTKLRNYSLVDGVWPRIALYDTLLTAGKRVWISASDDAHNFSQVNRTAVFVNANSLSAADIKESLRAGNFYAEKHERSSGKMARISSVTTNGRTISISVPEASQITWIKKGGVVARSVAQAKTDSYTVQGDEGYVRIVVALSSDSTAQAFSQPIFVQSASETALSIATSTTTPTINAPFTLTGTLKSGTSALPNAPIHLESHKRNADGTWTAWGDLPDTYKRTDSTGKVSSTRTLTTPGVREYRWHYNGSTTYQAARSAAVTETVKKPTTLTITSWPATPTYNTSFQLWGTVKSGTTGLAGYYVHLERKVGAGAWADVSGSTVATRTGGTIPTYWTKMTTHGTYSYRWHFTGTGTYQAGYSPTKTFTV